MWSALEPGVNGLQEETLIWAWLLVLCACLWQHLIFNSNLLYYFKKLSRRALTHQIGSHGATFQVQIQFYCEKETSEKCSLKEYRGVPIWYPVTGPRTQFKSPWFGQFGRLRAREARKSERSFLGEELMPYLFLLK